jgi:hypothetical protein
VKTMSSNFQTLLCSSPSWIEWPKVDNFTWQIKRCCEVVVIGIGKWKLLIVKNINCDDAILDWGHYMPHVGARNGKNENIDVRQE